MFQSLIAEIKEYKKPSFLASFFMFLEVVFEISIPFVMALLLDKGVQMGDMQQVALYGGLMLVCAFLSLFCGMQSARYGAFASAGFAKNLRKALFAKVQSFSFENIDRFSSGGLVTRMMTDVTNVQNSYQMIIRVGVRAPLNLIFAIWATFLINGQMAMIFVWVALFLGSILALILKIVYPLFTEVFKAYDNLNSSIQENITNMRVVKSYVKEAQETTKFQAASGRIYRMFMKAINVSVLSTPAMMLSMYASFLMISWMGAHLIVVGNMSTGELTSMFSYTMTILMSLMMLMMIFVMLVLSIASVERINEVLKTQSTIVSPENGLTQVADGSIEFQEVSFAYTDENGDKAHVLEGINLSIQSGEVIGILGGTGSGKSSLVQLIPRFYDVTLGKILVDAAAARNYTLKALRQKIGFIPQKSLLFTGTIGDNLRYGKWNASEGELEKASDISQAREFIHSRSERYEAFLEEGGSNLSGGQKQRLSIARAVVKRPDIYIFDDSFSALDYKTDRDVRAALRRTAADATVIIVAQRIGTVRGADRILVVDRGRIVGAGTHSELLETCSVYREIALSQLSEEELA